SLTFLSQTAEEDTKEKKWQWEETVSRTVLLVEEVDMRNKLVMIEREVTITRRKAKPRMELERFARRRIPRRTKGGERSVMQRRKRRKKEHRWEHMNSITTHKKPIQE